MRYLITIEHPAWAHQFNPVIKNLKNKGHIIDVLVIKEDSNSFLLDKFGIKYTIISNSIGNGILGKLFVFINTTIKIIVKAKKEKTDVFIGRNSPMVAIASFILKKPHYLFDDTEHATIAITLCKIFSTKIMTNKSYRKNLGKKQIKIPVYKELFYLHPNNFLPDRDVLKELNIKENEKIILIRYVDWQSTHDRGYKGFSDKLKIETVTRLSKYGKIFISSEGYLPKEMEQYRLKLSFEKVHHLIYYATLVFGESATMASEAACLGTHSVFCDFAGRGYTDEQESRYKLVKNFKLDNASQIAAI